MTKKRIAVYFDCENIDASYVKGILNKLSHRGKIVKKQSFKDWTNDNCKAWNKELHAEYGIEEIQVHTKAGKNSADLKIVRMAMETIYQGNVDIIALVTSDSDFRDIVFTITNHGLDAIGFGEKKTSKDLREAYTKFFELPIKQKVDGFIQFIEPNKIRFQIETAIKEAIQYKVKANGFAYLCQVITYLKKKYPNYPEAFGMSKWISVIKQRTDIIIFEHLDNKKTTQVVRLKNQ